ncbi:MAG: hypothetical protein IAI48_15560 [Candidatus Eremiobacteraeota bacterium]|nr:hypothetical protein [Candidatus Eremiobacteraeota bacterium]
MNKVFTVFFAAAIAAGASSSAFAQATATQPTCGEGDVTVWENTSTKVYHLQGDKYYGKTKHGAYACKSAADSAGFHAAGSKSAKSASGAATSGAVASPAAMASAAPAGKHHRHKKSTASPAPASAASMTPGSTAPDVAPSSRP